MESALLGSVLAALVAGWALAFLLQLVDVVTGHQVRRAGRAAGHRDRDRILSWVIAVCSIVLVLLIVGVDVAMRLLVDHADPLAGLLSLVGLMAAAAVTALLAARALRRPQTGYQVLRDELKALVGVRPTKGRIADYRSWLAAIDDRENDLHRRVVAGRWVRAIPVLLALAVLVIAVLRAIAGELPWWQAIVCLAPVILSTWLSIWGARSSLARNLAIHAVHQKQRAEAQAALDELERKAPRKVAGLSERVSRALAILREQQGQRELQPRKDQPRKDHGGRDEAAPEQRTR